MSAKGKFIMDTIKNLDAFYNDLGLLLANFESMLGKRGFSPQQVSQPNRVTFSYQLSSHVSRSNRWTLKCIERMYLKEDEIRQKSTAIKKAILCSLAMFPTSAFDMPVLILGTLGWNVPLDPGGAYNHWPTEALSGLVEYKKNWCLKEPASKNGLNLVYRFSPVDEVKNIEDYSVFLIDLVKIESTKVLEEIVNSLIDLYSGASEVSINPDVLVDAIPPKLMEVWVRPMTLPSRDVI